MSVKGPIRAMNRVIGAVLQENLLAMTLSTPIPEALRIGEYLRHCWRSPSVLFV
jgi:hypothetical protein